MSTDAGVKEAPHSYHISLNFQEVIDEDLASVVGKWHRRRHVLKITHVSPGRVHFDLQLLLLLFRICFCSCIY